MPRTYRSDPPYRVGPHPGVELRAVRHAPLNVHCAVGPLHRERIGDDGSLLEAHPGPHWHSRPSSDGMVRLIELGGREDTGSGLTAASDTRCCVSRS